MAAIDTHPTVVQLRLRPAPAGPGRLDAGWLRDLCREAGADDVGFVRLDRPELDDQREAIRAAFPATRFLISLVGRMNREPVRSVNRSVSNLEFHHSTDHLNEVARTIVRRLEEAGCKR